MSRPRPVKVCWEMAKEENTSAQHDGSRTQEEQIQHTVKVAEASVQNSKIALKNENNVLR